MKYNNAYVVEYQMGVFVFGWNTVNYSKGRVYSKYELENSLGMEGIKNHF